MRQYMNWILGAFGLSFFLLLQLSFRTYNTSFRQTPTFGGDTIRKFATNASEMKKLAARDYADLLQVRLPSLSPSLKRIVHQFSVRYSRI